MARTQQIVDRLRQRAQLSAPGNLDTISASAANVIESLQARIAELEQGKCLHQIAEPAAAPFMYAIADGYGNAFFEEQGCVSSEAKDLQPEVDSLNQNLDGEPPYRVVALHAHPAHPAEGVPAANAEDAAALLGKYRKLCIEIGRGDSYHLKRIEAATAALAATHPTQQGLDVVAAAKALCKHAAKIQNVNFDDYWLIHGDEFKQEAQLVLDAAQTKQGGA